MAGYLHITRLKSRTGTDSRVDVEYQVNYVIASKNYAIAFDEPELAMFLQHKVPLDDVETARILADLEVIGHANIGDVDIPEAEATSMGMEVLPDDV
jgi:hypothetical protein